MARPRANHLQNFQQGTDIMSSGIQEAATKGLVDWAKGQPFTNVLLTAIFAAGCWFFYFGLNVAIPSHIKSINDSHERIEASHKNEREKTIETYDKWVGQIVELKREAQQATRASAPVASAER
jgi:hypothetical protein